MLAGRKWDWDPQRETLHFECCQKFRSRCSTGLQSSSVAVWRAGGGGWPAGRGCCPGRQVLLGNLVQAGGRHDHNVCLELTSKAPVLPSQYPHSPVRVAHVTLLEESTKLLGGRYSLGMLCGGNSGLLRFMCCRDASVCRPAGAAAFTGLGCSVFSAAPCSLSLKSPPHPLVG